MVQAVTLTPTSPSVMSASPPVSPQVGRKSSGIRTAGAEARVQDLMLRLQVQSFQSQEVARFSQASLLKQQVSLINSLASSARWEGIRNLGFGLASGAASCTSPFLAPSLQQTVQGIASAALPQISKSWDSFAECGRMPKQLERSHLDHHVQLRQGWVQQLQGQDQKIQDIFRSAFVNLRQS
jgi:hypothetical protein